MLYQFKRSQTKTQTQFMTLIVRCESLIYRQVRYEFQDVGQRPPSDSSASDSEQQLRRSLAAMSRVADNEPGIVRARRIFGTELHASWDHWNLQKRRVAKIPDDHHTGTGNTNGKEAESDSGNRERIMSRPTEAGTFNVHPAALHRYRVSSLGKYVVNKPRRQDSGEKRHIGSLMRNGGPWHHNKVNTGGSGRERVTAM